MMELALRVSALIKRGFNRPMFHITRQTNAKTAVFLHSYVSESWPSYLSLSILQYFFYLRFLLYFFYSQYLSLFLRFFVITNNNLGNDTYLLFFFLFLFLVSLRFWRLSSLLLWLLPSSLLPCCLQLCLLGSKEVRVGRATFLAAFWPHLFLR